MIELVPTFDLRDQSKPSRIRAVLVLVQTASKRLRNRYPNTYRKRISHIVNDEVASGEQRNGRHVRLSHTLQSV
jgi:hypothetical protein